MSTDWEAKKEYIEILLQQYSEVWEAIRNDSNAVWQIPTLLLAAISVLGIAFTQLPTQLTQIHLVIARISILIVAFGFSLVSSIALAKHRLSCKYRTADFKNIQEQLKSVLGQVEFNTLVQRNKEDSTKYKKLQFREIDFSSKYMEEHYEEMQKEYKGDKYKKERLECFRHWLYRRSAYDWQLFFTGLVVFGVGSLLIYVIYELCRLL
jgi:hypothetical protein